MPSPDQQRMDAISEALAGIVRGQRNLELRLARIEQTLGFAAPVVDAAPPPRLAPAAAAIAPTPPPLPVEPPPLPGQPGDSTGPGFEADPQPSSALPSPPPNLETAVGLTLINRVGAITIVIGIGFFFKWAVDNQYIGPAGRVELGILAGLLVAFGADRLWNRGQKVFAQGVSAAGISILYLSFYAAFGFYQLIPQATAFAAMFLVTLMAGTLALRYGSVAMAALGLVGGYLTPLMLSTGEKRPWFLFTYILILSAGGLALARFRSWRSLEILSFIGTLLLFGLWMSNYTAEYRVVTVFFALVFYALFASTISIQPLFLILQIFFSLTLPDLGRGVPGLYFALALVLGAAGLAVADLRRWRFALAAAAGSFWLATLIYIPHVVLSPIGIWAGATAGFLLFLAWIPWWTLLRRQSSRAQDLATMAVNSAAYFGLSYHLLNDRYHAWLGLLAVAVAGVHVGLGYLLWRRSPAGEAEKRTVLLSLGVAIAFLTLAAPIQFSAYRITMAWALQAAVLTWIGARLNDRRMSIGGAIVFGLSLLRLASLDSEIYSTPQEYSTLWNARFLTFAVTAASLVLAAYWNRAMHRLRIIQYMSGHIVLLWALTMEALGWAGRTAAPETLLSVETISISILFALYAILLVSLGVATRTKVNRVSGLALIGVVILKLYLFDVWQLSRVYRTLAFVGLGVLMLSTSFLYSRFRGLIETWWKDEKAAS